MQQRKSLFNHHLSHLIFFVFLSMFIQPLMANEVDDPRAHIAIPLLDEDGLHVLDTQKPYSSKQSCGGCHDYEKITHAYHFETGRDEASDDYGKKSGLLQLVSPGYYGGYNCMGGDAPDILAKKLNASSADFADHGSAGYVMRCNSCHSGGGWMEKDRDGIRYDEKDLSQIDPLDGDYFNRGTDENNQSADLSVVAQWDWSKSGVVENDCLLCHTDMGALMSVNSQLAEVGHGSVSNDPKDMMRTMRSSGLISEGHFRYGNSAILEFINLNTTDDASQDNVLLSFEREAAVDVNGNPVVDLTKLVLDSSGDPTINWNQSAFDKNKKVTIPMVRYPGNDSCMLCHRTANSRRGFYGFGDDAPVEYEEGGVLVEDYKDDVHAGLTWKEDNGEEREIRNCNSCHAKNYYNPAYANVDVDADHNFPKGNSDMDLHNDLDYEKNPETGNAYVKSCLHCHEDASEPAIPSGHSTMLDAHRESWRASGDMHGYSRDSLNRITQKHLDVVTCEACHITDKEVYGVPVTPMYRYAASSDGKMRIRPYKPKQRNYWKNMADDYFFSKTERNSVFELRTDEEGNKYGAIIDPSSKKILGTVTARMSHGSWRFGNPADYDGMLALKSAYDSLLKLKGVANADAVMVVSEINHYVLSHGTKPATQSVQCEQCHEKKQNGSFSALISPKGILGAEGNEIEVTTVVDTRLVDDGIVILDYPYMKMDENGKVTENVDDILYYSGQNPSLSRLNTQESADTSDIQVFNDSSDNESQSSSGSGGGSSLYLSLFSLLWLRLSMRFFLNRKNDL